MRNIGKYIRTWNEEKYKKYIKKGRGQGEGSLYKPWITVHDFPSCGIVSRIVGWKTGRIHHLMSNHELRYFYLLEWSDNVLDIREQFPLMDLSCAMDIAQKAGVNYPVDNTSGFPYVMTSDFMISTKKGLAVRTIKMSDELIKPRVIEKLEIERRYWKMKNINWKIVTEKEINKQKAKNIEWLYSSKTLDGINIRSDLFEILFTSIKHAFEKTSLSVLQITQKIDADYNLQRGTSLKLFKHLVFIKQINLDIKGKLDLSQPRCVAISQPVFAFA